MFEFSETGRATMLPGNFTEKDAPNLAQNQMLASDGDISYFAAFLDINQDNYSGPITIEDVMIGRSSVETLRMERHFLLLGGRYEVVGKITRADKFFRISGIMGSVDVCIKRLQVGDPFDDDLPTKKKK